MKSAYYDEYVQGWTSPIDYDLKHRDPSTNVSAVFDATGMTPAAVLKDCDGNAIDVSTKVEWQDQSNSRIRLNPAADTFLAANSPYTLHWKVTDASGKIAYYPQGTAIQIKVYPS